MASPGTCEILVEDPELAGPLDGRRLEEARRDCRAAVCERRAGPWTAPFEGVEDARRGIGMLVIEGLIVRQVGMAGRFGAELLGAGDLMCPWQWERGVSTLPQASHWRVLRDCRIAILGAEFTERVAAYPEVISMLFRRALDRARHIAVNMAIVQQPRIDVRLHMLFWELADRWGRVHNNGVHVPVPLTHATLSELVAARRPTVTKALGELAERGAVVWAGETWLLPGGPPAELEVVGAVSVPKGNGNGVRPARVRAQG